MKINFHLVRATRKYASAYTRNEHKYNKNKLKYNEIFTILGIIGVCRF